ncbi:hypothetical protein [Chitinophaga qingshengii]|uniref:PH domain-containing protein n=1 Tax=Chitinophaga qingshengii TaxID=1569794 RepID=A0ABR7TWW7_9BACT|nr:hypothetical protein [Chitinophaga qingshengii]MBC9934972.1 hypothetical protein [Chitinophaga qingshengii]
MKYTMNSAGHLFFTKQIALQKRGLLLFPLAVLFLGVMIYLRAGKQIPLYAIPIPLLILVNAFVALPLIGANTCRKTIAGYEVAAEGIVRFICYAPLWSKARVYEVNMQDLHRTSGKRDIYKINPTIRISVAETKQLFYYFPTYFEDASRLSGLLKSE